MLVVILATGFSHFHTEYDVEVLYTPDNARSKGELQVVRRLFDADDSVLRMTTLGEYGRVIVTARTHNGDVLADEVFREVEQLDRDIRGIWVDVSGSTFNYSALCARTDGKCSDDALLGLRKHMHVDPKTVSYPVHKVSLPYGGDVRVFLGATLSGVERTPDGETKATAWQLFYYLHPEMEHRDLVRAWQSKFLTTLADNSYTHISVARFTAHSIEDELARNVGAVQPLFGIMFATLVGFSVVSCMSTDWVRSKPLLGLLGVISSGLAVVSGFGLVLHCGKPFVDIVALSPFLILGKLLSVDIVGFNPIIILGKLLSVDLVDFSPFIISGKLLSLDVVGLVLSSQVNNYPLTSLALVRFSSYVSSCLLASLRCLFILYKYVFILSLFLFIYLLTCVPFLSYF